MFCSIVLGYAATLFTPETPEVFCGLNQCNSSMMHSRNVILIFRILNREYMI